MLLVSTGKSTILSDFADLETKSIYDHKNEEATDFQFYPNSNVFVEVNKKSGLEVMRVKANNDMGVAIQRVLKLKIENAYCVGCAHQSPSDVALGLSNGQIWVYNFQSTETLHRFTGEKMNSVVYVDFNAADDYIAATHENGLINIYGNKTHTKVESLKFETQPLLSRFHPTKRFYLSVASHKGSVIVYDTAVKKKVFQSNDSHCAPCRDCTWSVAAPDTLISVGYDCVINIFDTRRKGSPIKLTQKYPLSTVALSDCGQFFCVGNLKGGLATYDMRNTEKELCFKKVHEGAVNRVAFLPNFNKDLKQDTLSSMQNASFNEENNANTTAEIANTNVKRIDSGGNRASLVTARGQRDSFCDFMDFQLNKGVEKTSSRLGNLAQRDSFDWENLIRKPSWTNRGSLAHVGSNLSTIESDSNNDESPILNVANQKSSLKQSNFQQPLRERNLIISPASKKLVQIKEDQRLESAIQAENKEETQNISSTDKENMQSLMGLQQQQINSSTPIAAAQQLGGTGPTMCSPKSIKELSQQIAELRTEMDTRFKDLEMELKFDADRNKWQIFSQANDLWCKQYENIEDMRGAMMFLLQTDPFVQEFSRLKAENEKLKQQLERVLRKN